MPRTSVREKRDRASGCAAGQARQARDFVKHAGGPRANRARTRSPRQERSDRNTHPHQFVVGFTWIKRTTGELHLSGLTIHQAGRAKRTEHDEQEYPAAANNQRQKNSKDGATRVGFVRAPAQCIPKQFSTRSEQSAHRKPGRRAVDRSSRGVTNHAKRCFKRLPRSTNQHQTQMNDRGINKSEDDNNNRGQDQHEYPSNTQDAEMRHGIAPIHENAE